MTLRATLAALLLLLSICAAPAQTPSITGNEFVTGKPGQNAPGTVPMCINGSNVAVPCSPTTPLPVSGAGGGPSTIANGADVAEGNTADTAYAGSGPSTVVAALKGIYNALAAALPTGTNGIGNVGGKTTTVCVVPTVTITNSYGTNYVVGGKLTFASLFTATGSGVLQSVTVTIKKVETSGFTFFTFGSNPTNTTWTDAAVAVINTADIAAVRSPVSLSANSQLGTMTAAFASGIGQAWVAGGTTGYGVLIANAALTNQFSTTTDVQVCATVLNDL